MDYVHIMKVTHLRLKNWSSTLEGLCWLDNELEWTSSMKQLYKTAQSRMFFLRRLRSFSNCRKHPEDILSVCGSQHTFLRCGVLVQVKGRPLQVGKADQAGWGSEVGMKLDSLVAEVERRSLSKLLDILDNISHFLHTVIINQRSLLSNRLLWPWSQQ